jgi:hypothetical protein
MLVDEREGLEVTGSGQAIYLEIRFWAGGGGPGGLEDPLGGLEA